MRIVITAIGLLLGSFYIIPYHFYLKKLFKTNPELSWKKAHKVVYTFFKMELGISRGKLDIRGIENIPKDTPSLFVGNHRSYFDIISSLIAINQPLGFISKKEMNKIPILNLYMRDMGTLFLDRDDIRQGLATINQGAEFMKQGHSMVLFPEGHRNQTDELLPFKEGGYKMADKSGCPIVPFAITGSEFLFEKKPAGPLKKRKIIIEFGEPIYTSKYSLKERKEIVSTIPDRILAMRKTHRL